MAIRKDRDMENPRQSSTVHVETLGEELCIYDGRRGRVHALNPTAALVWRQCNGATTVEEMAAELRRQLDVPEAEAVVRLTLRRLAHAHLLDDSPQLPADRAGHTRRALLRRSVAAALLPAIYTIAVPTPLGAQSLGPVPTLTGISQTSATTGSTVDITITGTGFGTTVQVSGTGVTASILSETPTSLVVRLVIAANATPGPRNVTVTTTGGTSNPLTFTINPGVPTLTAVSPAKSVRGTVPVTMTGTNFVSGSTTITGTPAPGSGDAITAQNVVVSSSTSLTANLVVPANAVAVAQSLTVTTPAGTSGPISFLVTRDIPTLTAIVPPTGARGTTVAVTLTGTDFYLPPDSTVGVLDDKVEVTGSGITVQNLVGVNRLTLTADFVIEAAATVGPRSVAVTTPAGTSGAVTFTVT